MADNITKHVPFATVLCHEVVPASTLDDLKREGGREGGGREGGRRERGRGGGREGGREGGGGGGMLGMGEQGGARGGKVEGGRNRSHMVLALSSMSVMFMT